MHSASEAGAPALHCQRRHHIHYCTCNRKQAVVRSSGLEGTTKHKGQDPALLLPTPCSTVTTHALTLEADSHPGTGVGILPFCKGGEHGIHGEAQRHIFFVARAYKWAWIYVQQRMNAAQQRLDFPVGR